ASENNKSNKVEFPDSTKIESSRKRPLFQHALEEAAEDSGVGVDMISGVAIILGKVVVMDVTA
ncbi:11558_t:CDS:2, partial [Acaulospora colombiana]